jgi:hypothetical protein
MLYTANINRIIGFHDTVDDAVSAFAAKTGTP